MSAKPAGPAHDPTVLRAIAHPVRNRILGELGALGTARAADLAADLGIPANQASFHLRQLAKYGLVEEAPEAARDRRDRVWRLSDPQGIRISISEVEGSPGGEAAAAVWRRTASAWAHTVVDAAYQPPSRRAKGTFVAIAEETIKLTADEARELAEELDAVVAAWSARTRGRSPERRTYHLLTLIQPHPDQAQ